MRYDGGGLRIEAMVDTDRKQAIKKHGEGRALAGGGDGAAMSELRNEAQRQEQATDPVRCADCRLVRFRRRAACPRCKGTAIAGEVAPPLQLAATAELPAAAALAKEHAMVARARTLREQARERPSAVCFDDDLPTLDELTQQLVMEAVVRLGGVCKAAAHLRIGRTTVYRWMRDLKQEAAEVLKPPRKVRVPE